MKTPILAVMWVCVALLAAQCADATAAEAAGRIALVPQPLEVQHGTGEFTLNSDTRILVDKDSAAAMHVGRQLARRIAESTGWELKVSPTDQGETPAGSIRITMSGVDASLGREGYQLDVMPEGVTIWGSGGAGMFYGMQTLLQLMPPQVFSPTKVAEPIEWTIPAVQIKDRPRFGWRGLHLDVSRHFFNKDEIKNLLDLMAQQKLNVFHFHLTDDQGWRVEIKKHPRLTEVGAWRKGIDFGLDPKASTAYRSDGAYGGFYTQDDIRELVAYARDRYITIVPEIEMPGHSRAALSVYPELSCVGEPVDPNSERMGIFCAGNDGTFDLLEDVLTEVIDLFPSKYIHIGGDEVRKDNWQKCSKCQARIKHEHLKNEFELQSYFIKRIEEFINSKGRSVIGWDEILQGGLAPNAAVMSWRGIEGGIEAANAGHDVVMTPTSYCYFDYYQAKTGEPRAIGGFLPLSRVYSFEPIPKAVPADKAKHVLGAGGNLWSEYFANYADVQYMAFPRACAIAEVTWTVPERKNWEDFRKRLDAHLARLAVQGVNYRAPKQTDPGYPEEEKEKPQKAKTQE